LLFLSSPILKAQPFHYIAPGPDKNLWFTESAKNKIGRITTGGTITEFPIPTPSSIPRGIAPGPDKNLWFTESSGNDIGQVILSARDAPVLPLALRCLSHGGRRELPDIIAVCQRQ
jgi:streptogramin lyase